MRKALIVLFITFSVFSPMNAMAQESCFNFECQRLKILDPSTRCDVYSCESDISTNAESEEQLALNIFGVSIRLDSEQAVAQLIFLSISAFLGGVILAISGIGVFAAYKRSVAESEDDKQAAINMIRNTIQGFIIIVTSLLIVQLFASFIGLGSIIQLVEFNGIFPEGA